MIYVWAVKLALWVGLRTLRIIPVVGAKLSGAYEDRVFRPIVRNVSVEDVRGQLTSDDQLTDDDPPSVEFEIDLKNESWVDLSATAMDVRVGLTDEGGTVRNVVWAPVFDASPRNVTPSSVPSGGEGTVGFEFLADPAIEDETVLHLDGCLVFEYSFTLRDYEFQFGTRPSPLPDTAVTVSDASTDSNGSPAPTDAGEWSDSSDYPNAPRLD